MLLIISNTDSPAGATSPQGIGGRSAGPRELFYSLPSSKEEQGTSNTQIQDRNLG